MKTLTGEECDTGLLMSHLNQANEIIQNLQSQLLEKEQLTPIMYNSQKSDSNDAEHSKYRMEILALKQQLSDKDHLL